MASVALRSESEESIHGAHVTRLKSENIHPFFRPQLRRHLKAKTGLIVTSQKAQNVFKQTVKINVLGNNEKRLLAYPQGEHHQQVCNPSGSSITLSDNF